MNCKYLFGRNKKEEIEKVNQQEISRKQDREDLMEKCQEYLKR